MNMKQLKYVDVLSRCSNFTRAAEELGISQPSLSQYVKKIEQQLGTQLFVRTGQEVRLTDAGYTYLQIGRQMLQLENEMNNRLSDIANDQTGTITIGIAPYRCAGMMPKAIRQFREKFPGISIRLSEQITSELKDSAERGKLDLERQITPELFGYSDFSIYEGMTFKGWPKYTLSRGQVIQKDGVITAQCGRGKYIRRHI